VLRDGAANLSRLIYAPEMVELLRPHDAKLTDQIMIGRAVQEVNRLALIKLDSSLRQITVNPSCSRRSGTG